MEITEKEYEALKAKGETFATFKKNLTDRGFESVDDLIADRDQLGVNNDKLEKDIKKSGETITRQGAELGQLRKKVETEGGILPPTTDPLTPKPVDPPARPVAEELVELEGKMADEHWKLVDEFYADLDAQEAAKLAESEKDRRDLYKTVLAEKPIVPKSLRDTVKGTKTKSETPTDDNTFSSRFNKFLKNETYTPAGPGSGAPRGSGKPAETPFIKETRTY